MSDLTPGSRLRAARRKKQWTQVAVATSLGMRPARLCQLERDQRHPSRDEWSLLATCLALGPYPTVIDLPPPVGGWRSQSPGPDVGDRSVSARRRAARRTFGLVVDVLSSRVSNLGKTSQTFLQHACLESGTEYFFWLKLLAEGGHPCCYSPARAGFRNWPILARRGVEYVGDLRLPCLEMTEHGWLLFPQLTVDTRRAIYRLDVLVCCRIRYGRIWINVEVDGSGHESRFDQQRQADLGLPTVRIDTADLMSPKLVPLLSQRISAHLSVRKAGDGKSRAG